MSSKAFYIILIAVVVPALLKVHAGDPDLTSDFVVPAGVKLDANFFTFRSLRQFLMGGPTDTPFKVTKVSQAEFSALTGQSVSFAVLQYAAGGINPPHTHPRSAELLFVLRGQLQVGLVDSTGRLFTLLLQTGDLFVFPRGLIHYLVNTDSKFPAVALSAFASSNAGTFSLPNTLFDSGIPTVMLANSFKTDVNTISKIASANMG